LLEFTLVLLAFPNSLPQVYHISIFFPIGPFYMKFLSIYNLQALGGY